MSWNNNLRDKPDLYRNYLKKLLVWVIDFIHFILENKKSFDLGYQTL